MKAEEIETLKIQNQLLIEQNQLLNERNQLLEERNRIMSDYAQTIRETSKTNSKFSKIEILDLRIITQKLSLARLSIYQALMRLQRSLMKQGYLNEQFINMDIEENQKAQKQTVAIIQELENQRTILSKST